MIRSLSTGDGADVLVSSPSFFAEPFGEGLTGKAVASAYFSVLVRSASVLLTVFGAGLSVRVSSMRRCLRGRPGPRRGLSTGTISRSGVGALRIRGTRRWAATAVPFGLIGVAVEMRPIAASSVGSFAGRRACFNRSSAFSSFCSFARASANNDPEAGVRFLRLTVTVKGRFCCFMKTFCRDRGMIQFLRSQEHAGLGEDREGFDEQRRCRCAVRFFAT